MIRWRLHRLLCLVGWHSQPVYKLDANYNGHMTCKWCSRQWELDPRGSLFE